MSHFHFPLSRQCAGGARQEPGGARQRPGNDRQHARDAIECECDVRQDERTCEDKYVKKVTDDNEEIQLKEKRTEDDSFDVSHDLKMTKKTTTQLTAHTSDYASGTVPHIKAKTTEHLSVRHLNLAVLVIPPKLVDKQTNK